jgi:putative ABC transport system substrate-binding protein
MLFNPATAPQTPYYRGLLEAAAPRLGIALTAAPVNDTTEIEKTFAALGQDPAAALIALPDLFLYFSRDLITGLAARHRVPAIYPYQFFVKAGGLISYGADLADLERRSAGYVDRILKGERPAALPVQPPGKFELAINKQAARALGLELPPALLARAGEVIE